MVASILEGMGMVEKAIDELGGLIYKGPVQAYDNFMKNLWDSCGATTEHNLKKSYDTKIVDDNSLFFKIVGPTM